MVALYTVLGLVVAVASLVLAIGVGIGIVDELVSHPTDRATIAIVTIFLLGGAVGLVADGGRSPVPAAGRPSSWSSVLASGAGELIQQDDHGTLWDAGLDGQERVRLVEVVNATPELDGSYRHYVIRVPPGATTAREAIAWTFGFDDPRDYVVAAET